MTRISYGQRFEDLHLLRGLGDKASGFYIDVGAGHPVVDSVSFAFYRKGWRGITVEPNPVLARLCRAVRPRDLLFEGLAGAAAGEATFYLVDDFHGLSTMIERHAVAAKIHFDKPARELRRAMTTLAALCAAHAPRQIDFLKVDVEGAESEVLAGADFTRFRPRIVVVEALAPVTLAPAWDSFEPLLRGHGYRFAFFDSLNRYYVAEEVPEIARRLAEAPAAFEGVTQIGLFGAALTDEHHPDHRLATTLARAALTALPLLEPAALVEILSAGLTPEQLQRPAEPADLSLALTRLTGVEPPPDQAPALDLPPGATVRDLYGHLAASDWFRTALGRIASSYAW